MFALRLGQRRPLVDGFYQLHDSESHNTEAPRQKRYQLQVYSSWLWRSFTLRHREESPCTALGWWVLSSSLFQAVSSEYLGL